MQRLQVKSETQKAINRGSANDTKHEIQKNSAWRLHLNHYPTFFLKPSAPIAGQL